MIEIEEEFLVEGSIVIREARPFLHKGGNETKSAFNVFNESYLARGILNKGEYIWFCLDLLETVAGEQGREFLDKLGIFVKEVTSIVQCQIENAVELIQSLTVGGAGCNFRDTDDTTRAKDATEFF